MKEKDNLKWLENWQAYQLPPAGTIGLFLIRSINASDMAHHHQVLAYGYQRNGNDLKIHVYDPSCTGGADEVISLNISDPNHTTDVSYSGGGNIWSFFRITDYFFRNTPQSVIQTPKPLRTSRPPIAVACQRIVDSKEIGSELQDTQSGVNTPPFPVGGAKAAIAAQIKAINNRISQKKKELDQCIKQN